MRLTRRALVNDNAFLRAQHLADSAVIGRLLAEVNQLTAEANTPTEHPSLAENVRLAHHLEQAELELAKLRALTSLQDARLARFMADHPDIFRDAG